MAIDPKAVVWDEPAIAKIDPGQVQWDDDSGVDAMDPDAADWDMEPDPQSAIQPGALGMASRVVRYGMNALRDDRARGGDVAPRSFGTHVADRAQSMGAGALKAFGGLVDQTNADYGTGLPPQMDAAIGMGSNLLGRFGFGDAREASDVLNARAAPRSEFVDAFANTAGEYGDDASANLSPQEQEKRRQLGEAPGFTGKLAHLVNNPSLIPELAADSVPYIAAGAGAGGLVARAGLGANAAIGANLGTQTIMSAGASAQEARGMIETLPDEELVQLPEYQELQEKYDLPTSRKILAQRANDTGFASGLMINAATLGLTAKFSAVEQAMHGVAAPSGSRLLNAVFGAGKETVQEALQGGGEQVATNIGASGSDQRVGLMDRVGESALLEGVVGGPMGFMGGLAQDRPVSDDGARPALEPLLPEDVDPADPAAPRPAPAVFDEDGNEVAPPEISGMPVPAGPLDGTVPPDFMVDAAGDASRPGDYMARAAAREPTETPTMAPADMAQAAFDSTLEAVHSQIGKKLSKKAQEAIATSIGAKFGADPATLIERNRNPVRVQPRTAEPLALPGAADVYVAPTGEATVGRVPQIAPGRAVGDFGPGMYEPSPSAPVDNSSPESDLVAQPAAQPNPNPESIRQPAAVELNVPQTPPITEDLSRVDPQERPEAFGLPKRGKPDKSKKMLADFDDNHDDIVKFAALAGGLDRNEFKRRGIDPGLWNTKQAQRNNRPVHITRPLFKENGGMTLAEFREKLEQYGFLSRGDENAEHQNYDDDALNMLQDALNAETRGPNHFNERGRDVQAQIAAIRQDQSAYHKEADLAADNYTNIDAMYEEVARVEARREMRAARIMSLQDERQAMDLAGIYQAIRDAGGTEADADAIDLEYPTSERSGPLLALLKDLEARRGNDRRTTQEAAPTGVEQAGRQAAAAPEAQAGAEADEVAQLRDQVAQLQRQLDTDTLTSTKSREAFRRDVPNAKGVAFIDIVSFKGYNDKFTEVGGDLILAAFGREMVVVAGDSAYRRGGDELAILSDQSPEHAKGLADALTEAMAKVVVQLTGKDGAQYEARGIPFRYGTGATDAEAVADSSSRKQVGDRLSNPNIVRTSDPVDRSGEDRRAAGRNADQVVGRQDPDGGRSESITAPEPETPAPEATPETPPLSGVSVSAPKVSRDQERRLYDYLRKSVDGDFLRYELIAKKIQRTADGSATPAEEAIALDWLYAMISDEPAPTPVSEPAAQFNPEEQFAEVRSGTVGNARYQMFLDTLEPSELAAIKNNVPYMTWVGQRLAEATAKKIPGDKYIEQWAKDHLSDRVKAARAATGQPAEPAATTEERTDEAVSSAQQEQDAAEEGQQASAPRVQAGLLKGPKIEDFGEKLIGARKDYAAQLRDAVADVDITSAPLSKSWPEPDYQKLLDAGADPWAVGWVHAARDEVPTKPMKSWKLKGWVAQVELLRDFSGKLLAGEVSAADLRKRLAEPQYVRLSEMVGGRAELYQAVGHARSLKGIRLQQHSYGLYRGVTYKPPKTMWAVEQEARATAYSNWPNELAVADTKEAALAAFVDRMKGMPAEAPARSKAPDFILYSRPSKPGVVFIGKKIGRETIDLEQFATAKEARAYLEANTDALAKKLEQYKETPFERRPDNQPRVGDDHRNGAAVTPEVFAEAFGFRGVQFGNYVENSRRQSDLNEAYDALMNLADVIGVKPRALSLNGRLGLAFGSRGHGGKNAPAAHYELGNIVINLTKGGGPGSLAHEWWHALDNYFAKQGGVKDGYGTSVTKEALKVREEMRAAFQAVKLATRAPSILNRSRALDSRRTKEYWSTPWELSARSFETYVIAKLQDQGAANDYLANVVDEKVWDIVEEARAIGLGNKPSSTYPYPTAEEMPAVRAAFDAFFDTVESRDTDGGNVELYSQPGRAPAGVPIADLRRMAGAASVDGVTVIAVESPEGFPEAAKRDPSYRTAEAWTDGKGMVYLAASTMASMDRARMVLAHEVKGHIGVERVIGDDWEAVASAIDELRQGRGPLDKRLRDAIASAARRYPNAGRLEFTKEAIAIMAENGVTGSLWDRIIASVRRWLRKSYSRLQWSEAEIRDLLRRGDRAVQGEPDPGLASGVGYPVDDNGMPAFSQAAAFDESAEPTGSFSQPPSSGNKASWDAPEESRLDTVIYTLQDRLIDTKRVVDAIGKAKGPLPDKLDPYLQEELYHGRADARTREFLDGELKPLLAEMLKRKVDADSFETYLHARHAEERNAKMAEINPGFPDGGSGMTNADARKFLAGLSMQHKRDYADLAKRVDAIVAGTRNSLVSYGLESPDTVRTWANAYKNYVPLQREDMDHGFGTGTGQGFSVKGSASKRATGSSKKVVHILANIAMQRERAITRGEKNRIANALIGLATTAPNKEFWRVDDPPTIRNVQPYTEYQVTDKQGSIPKIFRSLAQAEQYVNAGPDREISAVGRERVVDMIDPSYKNRDNVVVARTPQPDGSVIERAVVFNEGDPRAYRMAIALKNLDGAALGWFLGAAGKVTRFLAAINTQYNPVFGMVNLTRDVQGAILNLSVTPLAGKQAAISKHILPALRGIYTYTRGMRSGAAGSSVWAQEFAEFREEGGQTGYRDMFRTSEDRANELTKELKRMNGGALAATPRAVLDWLSDFNETIENAVRLAAYKVGKDSGLSKARAASIAKNLTTNFNRKGQVGAQVGALYAFFNASVQGTARIGQTLAGPMGKKIAAGGVLLGVLQALALAAAGFDEDDPPQFVRERNLIIPIGNKKYLSIPMPLGFHAIPNIGRISTEFAMGGFRGPAEHVTQLTGVFAEALNPIGSAGVSVQTLTPSALDPLVALGENRDWSGRPIYQENFSSLAPTPGHTRARDTASALSRALSWGINAATGGTDYKPGTFSPTPDQIDYLIGQATGGVGREAMKVEQTAAGLITGEDVPPYKIPLFGRFYGDAAGPSAVASKFYDNVRELNMHAAEIKGRRMAQEPIDEYLRENPEARMSVAAGKMYRQISKMRSERDAMEERGVERKRLEAVDDQIAQAMLRLNNEVERLKAMR